MMQSHTVSHSETNNLRARVDQLETLVASLRAGGGGGGRSGQANFDMKLFQPDRFGARKDEAAWSNWAFKVRAYIGARFGDPALADALEVVEGRRTALASADVSPLGIPDEVDAHLSSLLKAVTEGDAMEIIKGAQGLPGVEAWRRLAAHFDPNVGTRNLADLQRCAPSRGVKH